MRRSASEIIRNLEKRIARLEKQSNIEWKVEGFPLDGDRLKTYAFRGNERQFIKWFKGENLENLLDDIQIYGDGDDWEVYNGKLSRTARLERQSARKSYILDQDEKIMSQYLERRIKKDGVENFYHLLLVALHDANFHSEAKAISSYLSVQGDGRDNTALKEAGEFLANRCGWDGSRIARVFAEAGKKDTDLIKALTKQNLL